MSERRKMYQQKIDVKLQRANTQEDREDLQNERKHYACSKFWNDTNQDTIIRDLYLQYMFLLELSMFPLSALCVERLFRR